MRRKHKSDGSTESRPQPSGARGEPTLWRGVPAVALCLVALTTGTARAADDLAALVAMALEQNPQLTAIEAQINALEHESTRVGAWQNPKLVVAYQNVPVDSFALGVEPMSMVMVKLEQTIPMPGKTNDRVEVTRVAAEAKRWQLQEKRAELRVAVETAYYRLALARHLEALTRDHVGLVEQLIGAVRIKYEVGRSRQENLLRLEVLRDRLEDDLEEFDLQQRMLIATINSVLHRETTTPISTPESLSIEAPTVSLQELEALAAEHRAVLKQLDVTARMHRTAADLSESEGIPDPTVFASYGFRTELPNGNPGRDLVTVGVGLPLPLFYGSRNAAQASQSREQARSVDATREATIDSIAGDLERTLATWSRAAAKVKTYRDRLVPDAHRTLDATFASYQVDRADFLSLFDAELDLLNFEKTIRAATVEGLVARSTIERIVGRDLP